MNPIALSTALLLSVVAALPSSAQTRRALIVGIDRYASVPSSENATEGVRPFTDLDGSVNDARAMRAVLEARYGFTPENIVSLTNEGATREAILNSFREHLIEPSKAGDIALFFYAGHGSLIRDSRNADDVNPYDQTLVPHDFNAGALPILDKELRFLLGDLLDKGAHVTAFFDSCHSGSITRGLPQNGKYRWIPPDDRDAAELYADREDQRPSPESRGAVVMSAAQDDQRAKETIDEAGNHHGLFSSALVRVLRSEPVDQSALNIYQRVRALVQTETSRQVPALGGLGEGDRDDARYAATRLIGPTPEGASGGIAVAVRAIEGKHVKLPGGFALGLHPGTELTAAGDKASARLRVTEVLDLDTSLAEVISGDTKGIRVGDLFEVTNWVTQPAGQLKLFVGAEGISAEELAELAVTFDELAQTPGIDWISDPTEIESATELTSLSFTGEKWQLLDRAEVIGSFATSFSSEKFLSALPTRRPLQILVAIPPAVGLIDALNLRSEQGGSCELVETIAEAHYALFGKLEGQTVAYSWVRPGGFAGADASELGMPTRTDWIELSEDDLALAGILLGTQAKRIARTREWLQLESPAERRPFPYHLVLRDSKTKELIEGRDLIEGEVVDLVLHADKLPRRQRARFIYLLAIDSSGESKLLFGKPKHDNSIPRAGQEKLTSFTIVPSVTIQKPFGVDTLVLLTTTDKLSDTNALSWKGVRSKTGLRGATRGRPPTNPLERLLQSFGNGTRGASINTPADWSIQRVRFVTREAKASDY